MTVSSINGRSAQMINSLLTLRTQLDDLTRQISTGQKSDTFAGLGVQRGVSVTLRSQVSSIAGYDQTAQTAMTRIKIADTALTSMATSVAKVKSGMFQSTNVGGVGGASQAQITAKYALDEVLGLLNTQAGERYLFGGKATDRAPVGDANTVLNGDGTRAGLVQLINERKQADLGADGLGRLAITNATLSSVNITEDAGPFGFKLASVSSNLSFAVVNGPTGSPADLEINLASGNPSDGESLTLRFNLPDGTTSSITLTATTETPAPAGKFTIGTLPSDTTANLTTALASAIKTLGNTDLTAASAVQASNEFFAGDANNPPKRIDGPPFDTATALKDGTAADTVLWYTGELGTDPARSTAQALVDPSLNVGYGMRANEQGFRAVVQNIATLAAVTITSANPDGIELSHALNTRLTKGINGAPGDQTLADIQTELGSAQISINAAKTRHQQQNSTLQEFLQQIEGITDEEVGTQILTLQTRLQASMQVTSMMYQTSLVNYMQ